MGLVATIAFGTTSLMWPGGVWYSAGQATAASLAMLIMLWYLQAWKRSGRIVFLIAATLATLFAAWFWTVGLVAGFVARRISCLIATGFAGGGGRFFS